MTSVGATKIVVQALVGQLGSAVSRRAVHNDSGRFVPQDRTQAGDEVIEVGFYDPAALLRAHSLISVGPADGN